MKREDYHKILLLKSYTLLLILSCRSFIIEIIVFPEAGIWHHLNTLLHFDVLNYFRKLKYIFTVFSESISVKLRTLLL